MRAGAERVSIHTNEHEFKFSGEAQGAGLTTVLFMATRGAGAACGWFGFVLNAAATFDVFSRLEVTNDGLF